MGLLAACTHSSPTAPSVSVSGLAVDRATVALTRNGTARVAATLTYSDQTTRDVTNEATWGSSDPSIVTVVGGVITAVGIGTARVVAQYENRVATSEVVARRNTLVRGLVSVVDINGTPNEYGGGPGVLGYIDVLVENRQVYSHNGSDYGGYRKMTARVPDVGVDPGVRHVTLSVGIWCGGGRTTKSTRTFSGTFETETGQTLEIVDADTKEVVDVIPLDVRRATASGVNCPKEPLDWPIPVKAYANPQG
jgi:hypothetical protein